MFAMLYSKNRNCVSKKHISWHLVEWEQSRLEFMTHFNPFLSFFHWPYLFLLYLCSCTGAKNKPSFLLPEEQSVTLDRNSFVNATVSHDPTISVLLHTFAALHSDLIRGCSPPHRDHERGASHDHLTGNLLEEEKCKLWRQFLVYAQK